LKDKYTDNSRIPTLRFLLTDTNHPRRTAILVAHVANLLLTLPGVTPHILTAIDGIAAEAKRLLESDENITERLGGLISINQGLLNSVGVGHEKLDSVARITREVGWTKLTGAGGGGCALTLLKEGMKFPLFFYGTLYCAMCFLFSSRNTLSPLTSILYPFILFSNRWTFFRYLPLA
jgi:mevalonate kinase